MTRRIDLGPVALSFTEIGNGPPILFLHGFPDGSSAWGDVAMQLSDQCRCIMPDQRGYGLSDKPTAVEDYAVDHLLADINALAEALHLQTFVLAGHDWGGLLAWWYAARYPHRISRLIIANAPHPTVFQKALIDDPEQRLASQYITRLRHPGSEALLAGVTTAMVNWYRAAPFVVPEPGEAAALPDWCTGQNMPIDVPTLVLWGMRDDALLPGLLDGLAAVVPDMAIIRFDNAGHDIIREEPHAVTSAIAAFLT
jgi:pimeloyl-ACP methyl ester carboxylesterase